MKWTSSFRKRFGSAATAIILVAGASMMPAIASADDSVASADSSPEETIPDRTIYIDGPAPRISADAQIDSKSSTANTEVRTSDETYFEVIPRPGETVRVVYSDAVTDITTEPTSESSNAAKAAACTESVTAYQAYKSGNNAIENGMFQISTGCSAGKSGTVYLYQLILASSRKSYINNTGYATSFSTTYQCANNNTKNWFGKAGFGGVTSGPKASLACGMP